MRRSWANSARSTCSAEALLANDFHLRGGTEQSVREGRIALDAPIRIGRTVLPAHAEVHVTQQRNAATQLEAAARLSANFDRFNLATAVSYKKQYLTAGPEPPGELNLGLIGTGRIGDVRLRAETSFDVSPSRALPNRGTVGLLVGFRQDRLGGRSCL